MAGYNRALTIALTWLIFSQVLFASNPITIDGLFDDWDEVNFHSGDAEDNVSEDFAALKVTNDDRFLFLFFSFFDGEKLLQGDNAIKLFVDADNDKETGHPVRGIGAEVEWCFGYRSGSYYVFDGITPISQGDILLRTAPTITSSQFEMAIDLTAWPIHRNPAKGDTIRFFFQNSQTSDFLPDPAGGFVYVLDSTSVPPPEPIPLGRYDSNHLRILSYNTLAGGLLDPARKPNFQRIIKALKPDIMAFQEQGNYQQAASQIGDWLQTQTLYHVGMGNNNLVVSKFPILYSAMLTQSGRTMAVLLDTKITLGKNLLLLNSHLACCDNNASRQNDADEIISVLRQWRTGDGPFPVDEDTPLVHVGDFNLVGDSQQLLTLTSGDIVNNEKFGADFFPDWDSTPLTDLFSRHTAIRMGYTWRDDRSSFSPGKLDYVLYSDSRIQIGNHYILNTLAMNQEDLVADGLRMEDTSLASDHLPRIVDITPLSPSPVKSVKPPAHPSAFRLYPAFPNPFNTSTKIHFELPGNGTANLAVYNTMGQMVERLLSRILGPGEHQVTWKSNNRPSGVYICKLEFNGQTQVIKILLQK